MSDTPEVHRIAVRELVHAAHRAGDIHTRFLTRSSAIDGIRGHQRVQASRTGTYEKEVQVFGKQERDGVRLLVRGRVDGVITESDGVTVEEIKTTRGAPEEIPESFRSMPWAQAAVYGHLLVESLQVTAVTLRLTYLDLRDDSEFDTRGSPLRRGSEVILH